MTKLPRKGSRNPSSGQEQSKKRSSKKTSEKNQSKKSMTKNAIQHAIGTSPTNSSSETSSASHPRPRISKIDLDILRSAKLSEFPVVDFRKSLKLLDKIEGYVEDIVDNLGTAVLITDHFGGTSLQPSMTRLKLSLEGFNASLDDLYMYADIHEKRMCGNHFYFRIKDDEC
eukprot:g1028.t1